MILAGDVGGTKTTLALFDGRRLVRETTVTSHDFDSLESVIAHFLSEDPPPTIAALAVGVAGPVVDGRSTTINLPWHIDERVLALAVPVPRVRLMNDLEAAAYGIFALEDREFETLQAGTPRVGNMAVIAAGTGLGEALIVVDGAHRTVVASEGGHTEFGPRDELEDALARYLRAEFGRASYERILSGAGLHNLYRFLRDAGFAPESASVAEALRRADSAAVITEHALDGSDPLCVKATEMFVSVYGAEAGNLALKAVAVGGVVVTGGIAPKILPVLRGKGFLAAFRDKGRLATLMEAIPVRVALTPRAPLLGAACVAAQLLTA